jgi:ParB/RepB/Spo0J family partition protein
MDQLVESIRLTGILVPLTVYPDEDGSYQLLDGERRWRAARKLNRPTVPAIVIPKPDRLENILRMFNIHNVRTEWDQLASALKLADVMTLYTQKTGKDPTVKDLASATGLSTSAVRRLMDLLALPEDHKKLILVELRKPKSEQKFTEDFFYELGKAVKTIRRYEPEFFDEIPERKFADSLIQKYRDDVIPSIIQFRNVSRIARGSATGVSNSRVRRALTRLAMEPKYTIAKAYESTVEHQLWEREVHRRVDDLRERLEQYSAGELDDELAEALRALVRQINQLLR